jgi:hypothetical protein
MDDDYAAARAAAPADLGPRLATATPEFIDGALANPGLQTHHLQAILRNPAVTTRLIQRIARSPLWMKFERVRIAIVLNPRAPRSLVMSLLPALRWGNLLRVAAAPQVASTVRSGAAKIVALRLPELTPGEKTSLARAAPTGLVPLLLRETHPLVLRAALDNPRTSYEDVMGIIDLPDAPAAFLRIAAESERFTTRQAARIAIAAHPKVPLVTALRLVKTLDEAGIDSLLERESLQPLVRVAATRRQSQNAASGSRTEV